MKRLIGKILLFAVAPFVLAYGAEFAFIAWMSAVDSHVEQNCIDNILLTGATREYAEEQCY
ncbi:MAG: hypothetical protein II238_00585 [Alphaproteobacteria bacterium]|nr:hypothetical protein [Alphaproteobacteria bacterium]